jgi:hypothetical protein
VLLDRVQALAVAGHAGEALALARGAAVLGRAVFGPDNTLEAWGLSTPSISQTVEMSSRHARCFAAPACGHPTTPSFSG